MHEFPVHPSTRTHDFPFHPSARTHEFSFRPSARTHEFSTAFTVCALTKFTPSFLLNGSCPSPNLKKDFFARCVSTPCSHRQLTLRIGFGTFTTWKSYSFVRPQNFNQICRFPYSWSGFPLAPLRQVVPSDCSIFDFPNHLGHTLTEAPLSIITNPFTALIATILAQCYVAVHVFDREHKFFSRLCIGVFSFDLIHHFIVVGS